MKNYKQIIGYLKLHQVEFMNLNMILQKLKTKKYGPGNNKIKIDALEADIQRVFDMCELYYNYDPNSIRISRVLQSNYTKEYNKIHKGPFEDEFVGNNTKPGLYFPDRFTRATLFAEQTHMLAIGHMIFTIDKAQ